MGIAPLIVTAKLDDDSSSYFDALRRQHFPVERNYLKAHLTLFHHLPGDKAVHLANVLESIAANTNTIELDFTSWRSLGRGVAMNVDSDSLVNLRRDIAVRFMDDLTPQDRQPFRPHITIQNKVDPEAAKGLLVTLKQEFVGQTGYAHAVQFWEYDGGPWKWCADYTFQK